MGRLLIVAPNFAPNALMGARRPTRLARRIAEFGWEPYVLTTTDRCCERHDPALVAQLPPPERLCRVPCFSLWKHSKTWRRARPGLPRLGAVSLRTVSRVLAPLLLTDEWFPWALVAGWKGERFARDKRVDLIWATAPPLSGLLAARLIHRRTGIPYIADIRDQRRSAKDGIRSLRHRWLETVEGFCLKRAAGITHVAPRQIEVLRDRFPWLAGVPSALIYNWFDRTASPREKPERATCRLIHGGNLYGGTRRVDGFFEALAIAVRENETGRRALHFDNYGPPEERGFFERKATEFAVQDVVSFHAFLPPGEFEKELGASDLLVLMVGRDTETGVHAAAIPGKLYEYFSARRPILVIGPDGCEAGRMVERVRRGMFARDDNPREISRALAALSGRSDSTPDIDLSEGAVLEFTSDRVLPTMAKFFDRVAGREGRS